MPPASSPRRPVELPLRPDTSDLRTTAFLVTRRPEQFAASNPLHLLGFPRVFRRLRGRGGDFYGP